MSTVMAVAAASDNMKQPIAAFAQRASAEVTTHDAKILPDLAEILPQGSSVYVAHTPKATFDDVISTSLQVQALGLRASPHLVARRLPSESAVRDGLDRLCKAGVEQALLVAGDRDTPLGPFYNSLDVIASTAHMRLGTTVCTPWTDTTGSRRRRGPHIAY
jgi:methylenetetrahydrofolate reductase (NADPH)